MAQASASGLCPLRSVDLVRASHRAQQQQVVNLMEQPDQLLNQFLTSESALPYDRYCQHRSPSLCSSCEEIGRIAGTSSWSGRERRFLQRAGMGVGHELVLRREAVPDPHLRHDPVTSARGEAVLRRYPRLSLCGSPTRAAPVITGDPFTINYLLSTYLGAQLERQCIPHLVVPDTAWLCGGEGYLLTTPTIPITELEFSPLMLRSLFQQLAVTLLSLIPYRFSHGSPDLTALRISPTTCTYSYEGVVVAGPVTLRLERLQRASATIGQYQFCSSSPTVIRTESFFPELSVEGSSCLPCLFFRVPSSPLQLYQALRHLGVPLYCGAFDWYYLVVALLSHPPAWAALLHDFPLYQVWEAMWRPEELPEVERRIREGWTPGAVLDGIWLRCNVLSLVWPLIPGQEEATGEVRERGLTLTGYTSGKPSRQ